ncbi:MAG: DUF1385 domain-containing protein [candidate division Zixibacteria bacterium]|jgi:uncharacterized protein YqhQ|nr:DUF1385 domain-containing protein [candidate division Zixibacteria bacterium]
MPDLNVGGQAVIEGVMMRSRDRIATAVRVPSGEILVKTEEYKSLASRHKVLNIPVLRGAVAFVEMLVIGIRTLNFSADIAVKEAEKEEAVRKGQQIAAPKQNALYLGLTAVFALTLGIGVFFLVPLAITDVLNIRKEAVEFNLVAGAIRLTMFVAYVWVISLFGEFKRIFQYHGAEHKSIYAYEMGDDLVPERVARHTRFHPRCGTSFILIVALLAVIVYAISDTLYAVWTGHPPTLFTRFGIHFALLPVVAGTSFELLKLSGKTRDNVVTRLLIAPGLWLQKITTKEPSREQLEVGIVALEAALGVTESRLECRRTPVS